MKTILLTIALLIPAPAMAALSGYYDSLEQMQAMTSDNRLADALKQSPITGMSAMGVTSAGLLHWNVSGTDCSVPVYLTAIPPLGAGKTRYEIHSVGSCN